MTDTNPEPTEPEPEPELNPEDGTEDEEPEGTE